MVVTPASFFFIFERRMAVHAVLAQRSRNRSIGVDDRGNNQLMHSTWFTPRRYSSTFAEEQRARKLNEADNAVVKVCATEVGKTARVTPCSRYHVSKAVDIFSNNGWRVIAGSMAAYSGSVLESSPAQ